MRAAIRPTPAPPIRTMTRIGQHTDQGAYCGLSTGSKVFIISTTRLYLPIGAFNV